MPACKLQDHPHVDAFQFDVIAKHVLDTAGVEWVKHVGLLGEPQQLTKGLSVSCCEMRPPYCNDQKMDVNSFGNVDLDDDERNYIGFFLEETAMAYKAHEAYAKEDQYIVYPEQQDECAGDGTLLYRRYSCAGFVIAAYRYIGIILLAESIPESTFDQLSSIFPIRSHQISIRTRIGLAGDGPWPVVLPGHVMNSLGRSADEIRASPYQPSPQDYAFRQA